MIRLNNLMGYDIIVRYPLDLEIPRIIIGYNINLHLFLEKHQVVKR